MSESVQHAGSAHHSTTGDVYCMQAVPVTPRQVMFTVHGQCPSLHAEGLSDYTVCVVFLEGDVGQDLVLRHKSHN